MTRLIIFDLDGTLIDTREDIANACNHALEQCGFPTHALDEYNMLVGRGIDNLFRGALPEGSRDEAMVSKMRSIFQVLLLWSIRNCFCIRLCKRQPVRFCIDCQKRTK